MPRKFQVTGLAQDHRVRDGPSWDLDSVLCSKILCHSVCISLAEGRGCQCEARALLVLELLFESQGQRLSLTALSETRLVLMALYSSIPAYLLPFFLDSVPKTWMINIL